MASTPLLGLALPADGVTNWGTLVNTSITALLDSAVSGTTTITSTSTPYTLTTTTEAANEARQAVILCTGARPGIQTIIAPAQSKTYVLINATTGGFGVKIVGVGPTTGVTVPNGRAYMVAWNGSDFVITGLTTVNLATDVTGTLPIANGGTGAITAEAARTSLGATTVGSNMFTLTNPSAVTFPRFNADNTVSALAADDFRTAIGAGTGSGTVTSVTGTSPVASSGGATPAISLAAGYGDTQNPYASKTANTFLAAPNGVAGVPTFRAFVSADLSETLTVAKGGTGQTSYTANGVLYASGTGTLANGTGLTFDGTRLGLGVPAPFYTLDVAVTSGPFIGSFKNTSTSANQANIVLWSQGESGSAVGYVGTGGSAFSGAFSNKFVVGTQSAHDLGLVTNGGLRAVIDSSGNFGVGTPTPAAILAVTKTNAFVETGLLLRNANNTLGAGIGIQFEVGTGTSGTTTSRVAQIEGVRLGSGAVGAIDFYTKNILGFSATANMRLDDSGDLGIGTINPQSKLHVAAADTDSVGRFSTSFSSDMFVFLGNTTDSNGYLAYRGAAIAFGVANAERARIDSEGNLQMQAGAVMQYQPDAVSITSAVTLTNADIRARIIITSGASYVIKMPLGSTLDTLVSWASTNISYDFCVINTASGSIFIDANVAVTMIGSITVLAGTSAQFRIRRSAAGGYVVYRLS
jgi:hypothetical protein